MSKAYNFNVTVESAETSQTSTGTDQIKARVTFTQRGRQVTRTLLAQGKMAEAFADRLVEGGNTKVRALYDRMPTEDGGRGGEFLRVVADPAVRKAA